ncbi:DUF3800 domain-containing protein [Halorhabdus amylolytica]|uniref:DUF3800 domain-containing protein n=1 Tax=Halorhabdus amylolytica TaxID=2559573 RepID=UPI0010A9B595|nr:DUF3800 domain-containing protein [Halorhabdus amylolytica]
MSDGSIEVFEGTAPDMVDTRQNVPEQMTPILAVSPERGNMIRILNMVARGDQVGVPVYGDFRDSNDDPLPVSTSLQWEYSPSNSDSRFKVSREVSNLSFYQNTSFAEQANQDYVDESKHVLTQPEFEGSDTVRFLQITDIEELFLSAEGTAQIDWSNSRIEVDPSAIKGPYTRGR